jgi:hypothetical protein
LYDRFVAEQKLLNTVVKKDALGTIGERNETAMERQESPHSVNQSRSIGHIDNTEEA